MEERRIGSEIMDDMMKPIVLMFTLLIGLSIINVVVRYNAEERCKTELVSRGFEYVQYQSGGWFSNDECWGKKANGEPVRIW